MSVSNNIQRIRKEKGITQKELAEKLEISQSAVSAMERNAHKATLQSLERIATAMNVSLMELISSDIEASGWIPVSERLPSESDNYLCTIPLDADETYTEVLTFHKGRFYEDDDEWGAIYHDDVLAWMPLPKPYKESEIEE